MAYLEIITTLEARIGSQERLEVNTRRLYRTYKGGAMEQWQGRWFLWEGEYRCTKRWSEIDFTKGTRGIDL